VGVYVSRVKEWPAGSIGRKGESAVPVRLYAPSDTETGSFEPKVEPSGACEERKYLASHDADRLPDAELGQTERQTAEPS
jgi:hypothetical protein